MSADRPDRDGSRRPVTTVTDGADSWPFVLVRMFVAAFFRTRNIHTGGSGVTVETVGDDSWRVVTTRRTVTIRREPSPLLRPVTDWVYWTWVEGKYLKNITLCRDLITISDDHKKMKYQMSRAINEHKNLVPWLEVSQWLDWLTRPDSDLGTGD